MLKINLCAPCIQRKAVSCGPVSPRVKLIPVLSLLTVQRNFKCM